MFTEKAQSIIDLAKDHSYIVGKAAGELTIQAVLAAIGSHPEASTLLAQCLGFSRDKLRDACPALQAGAGCPSKLTLAEPVHSLIVCAKELAEEVPDRSQPGFIDLRHVACAMALSRDSCTILNATMILREHAVSLLTSWYDTDLEAPHLEELTRRLRGLRTELLMRVFGQDHAVHAFVEGIFNAELVATADTARKAPRAVFVFAGAPGVGKTFLAELGAAHLQRPYKRFDMSAYSGHQQNEALVGTAKSFFAAHPGTLTEFIEKNPSAVLLFDEIEKAHRNTIHLFLQILDAGTLEDKYHERNVSFRDTTIIFTTNVGRSLYDRPNATGVHAANATFHRRTVLDALENEKDPNTREPFFPAAICSRLATGYPVLFNYLRVNELERVAQAELSRVADLLEKQYFKSTTFHDLIALCLVLREGANVDARTLRSQAESFVKTELFKFCELFNKERLEEVINQVDSINFGLEDDTVSPDPGIRALFESTEAPAVLLVADRDLGELYRRRIPEVHWHITSSSQDALQVLAERDVDLVLLDIWIGRKAQASSGTIQNFDHVPLTARSLDEGQELLHNIHERLPDLPVYLLSIASPTVQDDKPGSVDNELFMACVRAGGARGLIVTTMTDDTGHDWQEHRNRYLASLLGTLRRLYREKRAAEMGHERKVLSFDTVPRMDTSNRKIAFRLRNFRFTRAIAAADVGEVLQDVERPAVGFADVIGATAAKEELQFFIDYLRNPRRFAALGLKPPKGVLLVGPPGTGKTMLARAMAGESNVAFIPVVASSFVTIWQGSGPQNIRDLFARGRKYAPSIIFIDEIDSVGRVRSGSPGGGHAEELTLNALLAEMDGFTSSSPIRPVFILAATNFKVEVENIGSPERSARTLDPALVRRFDRTILVDLPERDARNQYLAIRLRNRPACTVSDETIDRIAGQSAGMSIANLETVIEAAARKASKASKQHGQITDEMLEEAFESIRHGEVKIWTPDLLERTARHEAGHTIMYWLSGWWPGYVTVVARGHHGGYMEPDVAETGRELRTRDELLASIRTSLGGRSAEILYYGEDAGLSTGVSGDIEIATHQARMMVCAYGMDSETGLIGLSDLMKYPEALSSPINIQVNQAVGRILKHELDNTLKMLQKHRSHLDNVAQALMEKNRLTRKDLEQLLPQPPKPVGSLAIASTS